MDNQPAWGNGQTPQPQPQPMPQPQPNFAPVPQPQMPQAQMPQQPMAPPAPQPFAPPAHLPGQIMHPQYGAPPNPLDAAQNQAPPHPAQAARWRSFALQAVIILVVIIGIWLVYGALHKTKVSNVNDGFSTSVLPSYQVDGNGMSYSVNFFPGAKVVGKNNLEYLIATNSANKQFSVWLVKSTSKTSCVGTTQVAMMVNGKNVTICQGAGNAVYAGDVSLGSGLYQINLTGQQAIPLSTAKSIIQSLSF